MAFKTHNQDQSRMTCGPYPLGSCTMNVERFKDSDDLRHSLKKRTREEENKDNNLKLAMTVIPYLDYCEYIYYTITII